MPHTVRDIVTEALREIAVLASSETATDDEADHGFRKLNDLVDQWQAEKLQIYQTTRTTWTIVSGTQDYTVGTGGTVNVARPTYIDHVHFVDTSTDPDTEYELTTLTDDAWSLVQSKALTSPFPTYWYYNPTYPLGTLTLWPVPTSSTLTGAMYAPQAVAEFANLNASVDLPPGYRRMLITNLACYLAPSYERDPRPHLAQAAMDSKSVVKRSNKRLMDMQIDSGALIGGSGSAYDIYVGP